MPSQLSEIAVCADGGTGGGGDLIIAAADNWDHNENTLSGKRSTHAMTSILVQSNKDSPEFATRIPRVQDRSIDPSSLPG